MKRLFTLLLFCLPQETMAESTLSTAVSTSWSSSPWKLNTFFDSPSYQFLLSTGEGRASLDASEKRLQFVPSNNPEVGFVLSKGIFHIGYRTNLPFLDSSTSSHFEGQNSKVTDVEMGFRWKMLEFGAFYSHFKGYYVDLNATSGLTVTDEDGTTTITTGNKTDGVPDIWLRPDLETYNYGLFTNLHIPLFGKGSIFDLSKIEDPGEFLNVWDFAFIMGGGYQRLAIEGAHPFVPEARSKLFPDIAELTGIYQHIVYAQVGLSNTFHFGPRWYMQFNMTGGGELLSHYQRNAATDDRHNGTTGGRLDLLLGFGYQGISNQWALRYKSSFRMMDKLAATNLDSQFSHVGVEYTHTF